MGLDGNALLYAWQSMDDDNAHMIEALVLLTL